MDVWVFVVPWSMAQVVHDLRGCREPWAHQMTAAALCFTPEGSQTGLLSEASCTKHRTNTDGKPVT